MSLPVHFHYNRVIRDRFQYSDEAPPPVDGQLHFRENPLSDEALEMRTLAQDPIETRRRDFQRVMTLDRILDLEYLADRVAHSRAIVNRDVALARIGTTIDEDP